MQDDIVGVAPARAQIASVRAPVRRGRFALYSPIRHVANGIWGNHDPSQRWLVAFSCYSDAGGSESNRGGALVVLGLIATEEKWLAFERKWVAALQKDGLTHFHMEDFVGWKEEFASWKGDEPRRIRLLQRLIGIVRNTVEHSFFTGFHLADYDAVNEAYMLDETLQSGPYGVVARAAHGRVELWMDKHHPSEDWHHFVEHGDVGQAVLADAIQHGYVEHATILPKKLKDGTRVRPFEAADMIVWEYRRLWEHWITRDQLPSRKVRESLREMVKRIPVSGGFNERAELMELVERLGFERR